jgi:hypothetical protein
MTGLVRKATLLCACGLLYAGAAMASLPSAANSDLPHVPANPGGNPAINIVGDDGGARPQLGVSAVDGSGQFSVTVRDIGNNLMPGIEVAIDFTLCSDVSICRSGTGAVAGQVVDCDNNRVTNTTNVSGVAVFNIIGAANNSGDSPGADFACAEVFAGGVSLGSVTAIVYDQNGVLGFPDGMNITDVSVLLTDVGAANYYGRSDFDANGLVNITDASFALTQVGLGNSSVGCLSSGSTYCP